MEKKQSSQKTKNFLKKNVYYIIMAVCLLAIAAMITVTVLINNGVISSGKENLNQGNNEQVTNKPLDNDNIKDPTEKPGNQDKPNTGDNNNNSQDKVPTGPSETDKPDVTQPTAIVFASPVSDTNIVNNYSMDMLVWNSTLKHYAVHNGIDFQGQEGANVYCVYDGVVSDISYDVLNGNTVTIKHNDNLYTKYSSLNEPVVKVGQTVKKGGVIGTMGKTATAEYSMGAHVHFTVMENNNPIDPKTYLTITDQK